MLLSIIFGILIYFWGYQFQTYLSKFCMAVLLACDLPTLNSMFRSGYNLTDYPFIPKDLKTIAKELLCVSYRKKILLLSQSRSRPLQKLKSIRQQEKIIRKRKRAELLTSLSKSNGLDFFKILFDNLWLIFSKRILKLNTFCELISIFCKIISPKGEISFTG